MSIQAAPAGAGSVIDSIGVALPDRVMTTREVLDGCRSRLALPLEQTTGIVSRRVAGDVEYALDLATRAAEDCVSRSSIGLGDVDLLISASISRVDSPQRSTYEPSAATHLRHRLGCERAWAFDVTNACAGQFTGIYIADALIRAGEIGSALIVSGEYISHLMRTAQLEIADELDARIACLTLGDAGAAVLLTRADDGSGGFDHIGIRTVGRYHTLCVAGPTDRPHGGVIMKTDMMGLAAAGIREMVAHTQQTLGAMGLSPTDFDRFIPHQTSTLAIQAAVRRTNKVFGGVVLDERDVINNLPRRGNTATTTHTVALRDASLDGRIRTGDRVLFEVAASGVNVGTAAYRLDGLPDRLARGARSSRTAPPPRRPASWRHPVRAVAIGLADPTAAAAAHPAAAAQPGAGATTLQLIGAATGDCLRRAGVRASGVDLLIHVGVYRTGMIAEPAIAAIAAGELGFDGSTAATGEILAFDVANGALGMLDGCRIAAELIRAGKADTAVVVASEVEQREPGAVGPAVARCGSAVLLRLDPDRASGFLGFHSRSVATPAPDRGAWVMQDGGHSFIRATDRTEPAAAYAEHLPVVVAELLDRLRVRPDAIRAVVPPWLPPPVARRLRDTWPVLGPRLTTLPPAWDGTDLFTSALPIGLRAVSAGGGVSPGELVVVVGASTGMEIGAALYRI
ncbi:3-oxoacyl-[acyl-carrier-protein] synthase III C-terminal domain-containing protein [Micromonospora sp. NPDC049101]|uniref:3-oxoacyl-[acyl-carrier-protein] synthase III C-terminal domain-containing protein n=1 Tax=Micromonospora sp. NPDC049101 TaxID=3155032 RepID=UPI0033C59447